MNKQKPVCSSKVTNLLELFLQYFPKKKCILMGEQPPLLGVVLLFEHILSLFYTTWITEM